MAGKPILLLARLLTVPLFFVSGYKQFSAIGTTAVRIAEKFMAGFRLTAASPLHGFGAHWPSLPVVPEWAGALLVLLVWRFRLGVGHLICGSSGFSVGKNDARRVS